MTTPTPVKGKYGGPCNRSACLKPDAKYFNHANRLHYCAACAHELNTDRFTVRDAEGWWGKGMRFCEYRPTAEPLPEREWLSSMTCSASHPISDDDLCSDCKHCQYKPGENSECDLDWPTRPNIDGYIVLCDCFDEKPKGTT